MTSYPCSTRYSGLRCGWLFVVHHKQSDGTIREGHAGSSTLGGRGTALREGRTRKRVGQSPDEVDRHPFWDEAGAVASVEEFLHGGATARAVIHRPLIHVHPDEGIGPLLTDSRL